LEGTIVLEGGRNSRIRRANPFGGGEKVGRGKKKGKWVLQGTREDIISLKQGMYRTLGGKSKMARGEPPRDGQENKGFSSGVGSVNKDIRKVRGYPYTSREHEGAGGSRGRNVFNAHITKLKKKNPTTAKEKFKKTTRKKWPNSFPNLRRTNNPGTRETKSKEKRG